MKEMTGLKLAGSADSGEGRECRWGYRGQGNRGSSGASLFSGDEKKERNDRFEAGSALCNICFVLKLSFLAHGVG